MDYKKVLANTKVTSRQVDRKEAPWSKGEYRPHWLITLSYESRRVHFDFWNNIYNETPKKYELLSLLIGEACDGAQMTLDDMASEFGYTKPSEALRTYKGLQSASRKIKNLYNVNDDDLIELANLAHEKESES